MDVSLTITGTPEEIVKSMERLGFPVGSATVAAGDDNLFKRYKDFVQELGLAAERNRRLDQIVDEIVNRSIDNQEVRREELIEIAGDEGALNGATGVVGKLWARWVPGVENPFAGRRDGSGVFYKI